MRFLTCLGTKDLVGFYARFPPLNSSIRRHALNQLRHGRTTVIIAHRFSMVKDADHVVVLDAGRVVDTGTPHELIARDACFAHFARGDTGHEPLADGTGNTDQMDTQDEGADATMVVEMADV